LRTLDWTPAFAGETNLKHRFFSSFRRTPESSAVKEGVDVYTIAALLIATARPLLTFAILSILAGIRTLRFEYIAVQIVLLRSEILHIRSQNLELGNEMKSSSFRVGMRKAT
jgi:hypothetical protein